METSVHPAEHLARFPARLTMNAEQKLSKRADLTPHSFVYWKGKHIVLERKAIKNT